MTLKHVYLILLLILSSSWLPANTPYKVIRGERPPIDHSVSDPESYEPGVLIIKFSPGQEKHLETNPLFRGSDSIVYFGISKVDDLNATSKVRQIVQHFNSAALKNSFTERHKAWGFHLWYKLYLDENVHIPTLIEKYQALDEIEIAEPEYKKHLIGNDNPIIISGVGDLTLTDSDKSWIPNDLQFPNQWHYQNIGQSGGTPGADIRLTSAWELEKGNPDVIVAIVDGGIEYTHQDLSGNMWEGIGFNFTNNSPDILPHNHGTHVAGTVAAVSNNTIGVAGVAGGSGSNDGVRLMSCQVFSTNGAGGFHLAPIYAADNGAAINQNSWGYNSPGQYEQNVLDAIDYFNVNGGGSAFSDGGITIFSSGNESSGLPHYPSAYSGAIAVVATDHRDRKSSYSNHGSWTDISAPGGSFENSTSGVLSTTLDNTYGYLAGTSMAAPHVSGVIALMLSTAYGEFTPEKVKEIIYNTSDFHYINNQEFEDELELGAGRLNAHQAVLWAQNYFQAPGNPTGFYAEAIDTSSINLHWSLNDSGDNVIIAWNYDGVFGKPETNTSYNPGETIVGGGEVLYIGNLDTFTHDDLQPGLRHYYRTWSVIEEGNQVTYSMGTTAFARTFCAPVFLPVWEKFDDPGLPNCWQLPLGKGNWRWAENTGNPAPAFMFRGYPNATDYEFALETPPLNGSINGTSLELEFDLRLEVFNTNSPEIFKVYIENGNDWTEIFSRGINQGDLPWARHTIDITDYALNQIFTIRFQAEGQNSTFLINWIVDNIEVYPSSCSQPENLSVGEISASSLEVLWEAGETESSWELKWGHKGFDPIYNGTLVSGIAETEFEISNLQAYTQYDVYVRSVCDGDDYSRWTGPLTALTLATCPAPENLTLSEINAHKALVNWQTGTGGVENIWEIIWGYQGFDHANDGNLISGITEMTYELTGLENITAYDVYVRAYCSDQDVSFWTGPLSFITECGVFALPYTENFDDLTRTCWSFPQGQGNWGFGNNYPPPSSFSGPPHATFTYNPVQTDYSFSIASPPIYAEDNDLPVKIDFIVFLNNNNDDSLDELSVEYRIIGEEDWQILTNYNNEGLWMGQNVEHIEIGLEMEGLQGHEFQIRFRAHGQNSNSINGWSIDDIVIYQEEPICESPHNLQVLNTLTHSAEVNWQGPENAVLWNIIWEENGFDPTEQGNTLEVTSPFAFLENLEQNTSYDFYVKALCPYERLSDLAGPEQFNTETEYFSITTQIEGNGAIDPAEDTEIEHGGSISFSITPNQGHHIQDVLLNNESIIDTLEIDDTNHSAYFTISNVTQDYNVKAFFAVNVYNVAIAISPIDAGIVTGEGIYEYGDSVSVSAIPNDNYRFLHWEEDGQIISEFEDYHFQISSDRNLTALFQESTSIENINNQMSEVLLYPNPASGYFWIKLNNIHLQTFTVEINSILGYRTITEKITLNGNNTVKIIIEDLPSGIYYVKIPDLSITKKLIIK